VKGSLLMLKMRQKNIFYKHVWSYPNKEKLDYIRTRIEKGEIKAVVDKVFDFENAIEALEYLETNRAKGKVIVKVK
jgi:alcohol dehydrogenase